jgi:branched-chain amino acid transport system ATP-binding protein
LRTGATLLLLDEPTEGLAPVIVKQIGEIIRSLKARRLTVLLVEQNLNFAAMLADRHYVVEDGAVIDELSSEEVRSGAPKLRSYLGV